MGVKQYSLSLGNAEFVSNYFEGTEGLLAETGQIFLSLRL